KGDERGEDHPVTQQPADNRAHRPAVVGGGAGGLDGVDLRPHGNWIPLTIMPTATSASTGINSLRIVVLHNCPMVRLPSPAPLSTPSATGAATSGCTSPRAKYTPALAAAVTPIMKLLVDVETFIGSRMATSMAKTLNRPLPIPSSPEK